MLGAVLGGFGFTAYRLESARRFRQIGEGLQERISMLVVAVRTSTRREAEPEKQDAAAQPDEERPTGPPQLTELKLTPQQSARFGESTGHHYVIRMRGKEPLFHSTNAPANPPVPQSRDATVRMRGEFRESFLFAAPVDCVVVGRSIAAGQDDLHRLAAVFAAVGGVVLAAGLVGGWWLATRAIRPVEDISATAAKIAAGDLSQRISTAETDSGLGRLANVLNSTFARLDSAFTQQARFTAEAPHELRTPVTVNAPFAPPSPGPADEAAEAALEHCLGEMRLMLFCNLPISVSMASMAALKCTSELPVIGSMAQFATGCRRCGGCPAVCDTAGAAH